MSKNSLPVYSFLLQLLIFFFQLLHFRPFDWFGRRFEQVLFSPSIRFIHDFSLIDQLLISYSVLILIPVPFPPQMKSILTFHLSFCAPPPQVHFLFGVWDEISDVLGNIILLSDASDAFLVVVLSSMQSTIPPFLPWATSISTFCDAWKALGELLKDKPIFSFLRLALFRAVFQVYVCIEVACRRSSLLCRSSGCDTSSKVPFIMSCWNWWSGIVTQMFFWTRLPAGEMH